MSSELVDLAREGRSLAAELVIDTHAHVGPYPCYYIPHNSPAEMVREMDRTGIRLCWAFPFMLNADWIRANDDVIAAVAAFPTRFWGFAAISPHYPGETIAELERCLAAGCVGVKLHPDMHQFNPDTVDLSELFAYLNRYGLICHSHHFGSAETLARLTQEYPDLTFVASHFTRVYDAIVRERDNLYICACTPWSMRSLEQFVEDLGAAKLLMGSDFPCLDVVAGIAPVLYAEVGDEQKRHIVGLTAQAIMDRVDANAQRWREEHQSSSE